MLRCNYCGIVFPGEDATKCPGCAGDARQSLASTSSSDPRLMDKGGRAIPVKPSTPTPMPAGPAPVSTAAQMPGAPTES